MCLHSSCWKAAGMSLTKPHDLRGFDDGIVYVLYFFMAPIELVQWHPSNISMWVAWLFIVTVLVRSITFLHLLILIQLEYLLFTVAEEILLGWGSKTDDVMVRFAKLTLASDYIVAKIRVNRLLFWGVAESTPLLSHHHHHHQSFQHISTPIWCHLRCVHLS